MDASPRRNVDSQQADIVKEQAPGGHEGAAQLPRDQRAGEVPLVSGTPDGGTSAKPPFWAAAVVDHLASQGRPPLVIEAPTPTTTGIPDQPHPFDHDWGGFADPDRLDPIDYADIPGSVSWRQAQLLDRTLSRPGHAPREVVEANLRANGPELEANLRANAPKVAQAYRELAASIAEQNPTHAAKLTAQAKRIERSLENNNG